MAGLVGALVIGRRKGFSKEPMPPHNMPMTMIGASLLWVGCFGFNVGSNLESTGTAALAMIPTFLATCAATVSWTLVEWLAKGKPSLLGGASGAIAGLVAITPVCGFVGPMAIGLLAGVFASPALGGTGTGTGTGTGVGVGVGVVWSGVVSFIAFKIADLVFGLRVSEDEEHKGLDISSHGEQAYHP